MSLRSRLGHMFHKPFKDGEDLFMKRVKFGEINEFAGRPIISSDRERHTLPFLTNPARSQVEKDFWTHETTLGYEYDESKPKGMRARQSFDLSYDMLKDRIGKEAVIFDIGCSTGYFLGKWKEQGFENVHGIDPQVAAVDYAKEHRPDIDIQVGFFNRGLHLVNCDLLTFYQTIYRIPYQDDLFATVDACAKNYVLVAWVEEAATGNFPRDIHLGMSRVGFVCVEKRVVNRDFEPFGTRSEDQLMLDYNDEGHLTPWFISFFLFKRVKPRT